MSALTSGSSVIISVSSAQGTVSRESPNLFPSHSLGFRSCLSHLMLICRGQGRVGEGSGFIALRHAIERNNEVTELDISQYLLWQRQGGRANLCWELNTLGNLGECMKPAAGLEGRRSAGLHVQPFPVFVHLAN